jgi:cyclopropane fatty-acyl-phospholipid synthase-like methyltransferase
LALEPGSWVLDVGSGLGGPARWIAAKAGCRVDALELQPELDQAARKLTASCGLEQKVQHVCGDILDPTCLQGPYDTLVSWLVFLHIPDRERLLERCRSRLNPGGGLYIEDFFVKKPLLSHETQLLREEVYCSHLVNEETYTKELSAAGFERIEFEDRTDIWRKFVADREQAFIAGKADFIESYDERTFAALASFYETIRTLFAGGRLGGGCILAHAKG